MEPSQFYFDAALVILAITAGVVNVALFLHILASKRLGKKIVKDVNKSPAAASNPRNQHGGSDEADRKSTQADHKNL